MRIVDVLDYLLNQPLSPSFVFELSVTTVIDLTIVLCVMVLLMYRFRKSSLLNIVVVLTLMIGLSMITALLHLVLTHWIINIALFFLVLSLPVILQSELRMYLHRFGTATRSIIINRFLSQSFNYVTELGDAIVYCSERKIGALIVIAGSQNLKRYIDTGHSLDSAVTAPLLKIIFHKSGMLHDGAVIIENGRIAAAGCVLPNSQDTNLTGMRHRAALGITESTDAISIVVSEETGYISIAEKGKLTPGIGYNELLTEMKHRISAK